MAKDTSAGSNGVEPPKYIASLIAAINDGAKAAQGGMLLVCHLLADGRLASDANSAALQALAEHNLKCPPPPQ